MGRVMVGREYTLQFHPGDAHTPADVADGTEFDVTVTDSRGYGELVGVARRNKLGQIERALVFVGTQGRLWIVREWSTDETFVTDPNG